MAEVIVGARSELRHLALRSALMAGTRITDLLASAFGGALGALVLRSTLKVAGAVRARLTPLAVHQCAASRKGPGEFHQCYGKETKDKCSTTENVWVHNGIKIASQPPHMSTEEHTIYGPYVNDFGKPGFYRVSFRLRGKAFPKDDKNKTILTLDVVQSSFGTEHVLRLLGQRIITAKELSGSYQYFDIVCYASGTDVYEYRCTVSSDIRDHAIIFFDCVKVYSHPSILDII